MSGDTRWKRQEATKPDGPHGWIQWKGTDACIDIYCACGEHTHVDGDFLYSFRCPACQQLYDLAGYVRLVPVPEDEADEHDPSRAAAAPATAEGT